MIPRMKKSENTNFATHRHTPNLVYFIFYLLRRSKRTCCFLSNKRLNSPLQLTLCACGLHHVKDVIESFLCLVLRWRLMQSGVCTRKFVHWLAVWTTIAETISVSVFYFVTSRDSRWFLSFRISVFSNFKH